MNAKLLREYIYYETTIEKYIIPFIRLHDEDFKAHLMLFYFSAMLHNAVRYFRGDWA